MYASAALSAAIWSSLDGTVLGAASAAVMWRAAAGPRIGAPVTGARSVPLGTGPDCEAAPPAGDVAASARGAPPATASTATQPASTGPRRRIPRRRPDQRFIPCLLTGDWTPPARSQLY